ncbi:MAG TPA: hypothetical protein VJQ45_00605 [Ktedonobacterales bacterium]|nr:hypothetical protein [Ktedonobacterales bacterium]
MTNTGYQCSDNCWYLTVSADCPSGKTAIAGGYTLPTDQFNHQLFDPQYDQLVENAPVGSDGVGGDGWTVKWYLGINYYPNPSMPVTVYADCATVQS